MRTSSLEIERANANTAINPGKRSCCRKRASCQQSSVILAKLKPLMQTPYGIRRLSVRRKANLIP